MLKFLHISDLHITKNKNGQVCQRLAVIRTKYRGHDLIVTGDVTDDGSEDQYQKAMYLFPAGLGLFACPGNHDYGWKGNLYDRKRAKRFLPYLLPGRGRTRWSWPKVSTYETKTEKVALIGLDSNIRTRHPFDFARGKIGWWQRMRLRRILKKYQGYHRFVYMHHHPFCRDFCLAMSDADKVTKVLDNNCEVVLFGHKHEPDQRGGRPWYLAAGRLDECHEVAEITVRGLVVQIHRVPIVEPNE